MDDDEIREFLMRWLMEFGSEPQAYDQRFANTWYDSNRYGVNDLIFKPYFHEVGLGPTGTYQINQAGLDFIKGE